MRSGRTLTLGVALVLAMGLASPVAIASPEPFSFEYEEYEEYELSCDGVDVGVVKEEWSQEAVLEGQVVLLVHVTRIYTVGDESRPFFRFVGSFVDRFFMDEDGGATSLRAGLDEGFIGRKLVNEATGGVISSGQQTLEPDEQACLAITG